MKTSIFTNLIIWVFMIPTLMGQNPIPLDSIVGADSITKKKEGVLRIQEVIPVLNQGYIVYKSDNPDAPNKLELTFYDTELKQINQKIIPTKRALEMFMVEKLLVWNNRLYLFASLYYPGPQKNQLLVYQYNLPDFALVNSKILMQTKAPADVYVPYLVELSADKNKLVLMGWDYIKPKHKASVKLKILTDQLVTISEQKHTFEYQNQRISFDELFLDQGSNVYLVGNNYRGGLYAPTNPKLTDFFVLRMDTKEGSSKFWKINKGKHPIFNLKYALHPQLGLVGACFWAKKNKEGGLGLIKLSPNQENIGFSFLPIEKTNLEQAFTHPSAKNLNTKSKYGFKNYEIQKLIVKENSFVLIGENIVPDEGITEFNEILVAKINGSNQIDWLAGIPKEQAIAEKLASFSLFERANKLYFLHNFLEPIKINKKETGVKLTINIAELPLASGQVKFRALKNVIPKDFALVTAFSKLISDKEALLFGVGFNTMTGKINMKKVLMEH